MIIGVKYANTVGTLQASWTDLNVASCFARPVREPYDEGRAFDGTRFNYRWKNYQITIVPGKLAMATSASRAIIEALLDSFYVRVFDARYDYLETGDSVNFVHLGGNDYQRDRASLLTLDTTIELVSESVI